MSAWITYTAERFPPLVYLLVVGGFVCSGAIVGGAAGAGTARRAGQEMVRRGVILIGVTLSIWLLARQMGLL